MSSNRWNVNTLEYKAQRKKGKKWYHLCSPKYMRFDEVYNVQNFIST